MLLFDRSNLLKFMKMVKCLPEFEYFYCNLEKKKLYFQNQNIKITDYAALSDFLVLNAVFRGTL